MSPPLLEVENLSVSFRSGKNRFRAVDGVSFSLSEGETLSLVGESGCGKSATALSLLRLLPEPAARIDSGALRYKNRDLMKCSPREMRGVRGGEIAMIFQEPASSLNPVFSVGEQIAEAVRIHTGAGGKEASRKAVEAMERVGIPAAAERYGHYPHEMSGGMKQRIMIAMALACRPAVLVADEPTTSLDATVQAQILELIAELQEETGMGVLLITHDLGVVAENADRVAVMYAGSIVELADVRALFSKPLHPYTRALKRALPAPGLNRKEGRLSALPGRVPAPADIPPYCRFYDRCPDAGPECKEGEPALREAEPGHFVRCVKA